MTDKQYKHYCPYIMTSKTKKLKKLDSVDELELSLRCFRVLDELGIKKIGTLLKHTQNSISRHSNFGHKSLKELIDQIHEQVDSKIIPSYWKKENKKKLKTDELLTDILKCLDRIEKKMSEQRVIKYEGTLYQ